MPRHDGVIPFLSWSWYYMPDESIAWMSAHIAHNVERSSWMPQSSWRTALLPCTSCRAQIKPEWPPSLWISPGPPVDRGVALDSSFLVVLTNFLGIVGCICWDDRRTILHFRNLKCFEGWFIEPGIMDICRWNGAGKRKTIPINQSTQLAPSYCFIVIIAGDPFFCRISLLSVAQCERSIFRISYPRPEQIEEDRLVHAFFR